MFGKLMSISDELMARYYELLLGRTLPTGTHPLEAKKQLAFEIVQTYHSSAAAQKTLDEWNTRHPGFECLSAGIQSAKIAKRSLATD